MTEDLERAVGADRRTFVKRLVIGTAFAVPAVSSLTMSGVEAVFGAEPGVIIGAANCNTFSTSAPPNYPNPITTFDASIGTKTTLISTEVVVTVVIPKSSLPTNTCVGVWGADLAAIRALVPANEIPVSGYAVVWNGTPPPDSLNPITLTVTDFAVAAGDRIYVFDKVTGDIVLVGNASDHSWQVTFTEDPSYVVTAVVEIPPDDEANEGGNGRNNEGGSDSNDDRSGRRAANTTQPATAVASEPRFTG